MAGVDKLNGLRVAILATDGVEQVELESPRQALTEAGATTVLVSPKPDAIQAFNHHDKGDTLKVDMSLDHAHAQEFDALVLPGGVINPDALRMNEKAVQFVREFMVAEKPVAAICHGPWTLVEAGAVQGRTLTSWPSLRTDIRNAGGDWVDREVVRDGNLVSSRKPHDLPAFNREMLKLFSGSSARASASADRKVDEASEESFPASDPPAY